MAKPGSLCRQQGQTCGACCWGAGIDRKTLTEQLEHNRLLFESVSWDQPSRLRILWHELRARRGRDLVWAVLFLIPWWGRKLRQRVSDTIVCAFIGFDSPEHSQVGCMLHPTRFAGRDIRNQAAFGLLRGIECGDPNFVCTASQRFDLMSDAHRNVFHECVRNEDWFDYTQTVRAFSCSAVVPLEIPERTGAAA